MRDLPHESGVGHVTGEAVYVDDIPVDGRLLVGRVVTSTLPHARLMSFDLTAARSVPGVHAVLSARDIPGENQMGPVVKDEPCLAEHELTFVGQAMFLIAAETDEQCREAERRIVAQCRPLEAILDIETAMARNSLLGPPRTMQRGDTARALKASPHVIRGSLRTGAQEHWYLESQVCLCIPGEGRELKVFSSTQHPSETQALVAEVLGVRRHEVVVEVRRLGGGFGGKETQANHTACWTALLAHATGHPVKIRLFRDDDMAMTGKRHRYLTKYEAGFDAEGVLTALNLEFNSDGGAATDLSFAIMERSMLHADNAYFVPNMAIAARVWKTNLPSNTAMRGFGAPQAMAAIELIMGRIAGILKKDPAEIRRRNFYGFGSRHMTHYGQQVEGNRLPELYDQLMESSGYRARREAIASFNAGSEFRKRGIALTPVKFGISFTTTFLNQAGALVNVYTDGSILVNHGGTEMGQGLHTKIKRIAADSFGVSPDRVKINPTDTSKIPNTSATAASSGADMNGMAVKSAIDILKERIACEVARIFGEHHPDHPTSPQAIVFRDESIVDSEHPDRSLPFDEAMKQMNLRRISLSAGGFYRTPDIGWDKTRGWGRPFYYFAFGMAVTEVEIDVLTGSHSVLRTDILHDIGSSLNAGVDLGQIEGGFVQGLGWCTTEEIKWDDNGRLMTHSPDTYKIPAVRDVPRDFRVSTLATPNAVNTVGKSKAVGEPPFMLALSAWLAIRDAIAAVGNHEIDPEFSLPATNEVIVMAIEGVRKMASAARDTQVAEERQ